MNCNGNDGNTVAVRSKKIIRSRFHCLSLKHLAGRIVALTAHSLLGVFDLAPDVLQYVVAFFDPRQIWLLQCQMHDQSQPAQKLWTLFQDSLCQHFFIKTVCDAIYNFAYFQTTSQRFHGWFFNSNGMFTQNGVSDDQDFRLIFQFGQMGLLHKFHSGRPRFPCIEESLFVHFYDDSGETKIENMVYAFAWDSGVLWASLHPFLPYHFDVEFLRAAAGQLSKTNQKKALKSKAKNSKQFLSPTSLVTTLAVLPASVAFLLPRKQDFQFCNRDVQFRMSILLFLASSSSSREQHHVSLDFSLQAMILFQSHSCFNRPFFRPILYQIWMSFFKAFGHFYDLEVFCLYWHLVLPLANFANIGSLLGITHSVFVSYGLYSLEADLVNAILLSDLLNATSLYCISIFAKHLDSLFRQYEDRLAAYVARFLFSEISLTRNFIRADVKLSRDFFPSHILDSMHYLINRIRFILENHYSRHVENTGNIFLRYNLAFYRAKFYFLNNLLVSKLHCLMATHRFFIIEEEFSRTRLSQSFADLLRMEKDFFWGQVMANPRFVEIRALREHIDMRRSFTDAFLQDIVYFFETRQLTTTSMERGHLFFSLGLFHLADIRARLHHVKLDLSLFGLATKNFEAAFNSDLYYRNSLAKLLSQFSFDKAHYGVDTENIVCHLNTLFHDIPFASRDNHVWYLAGTMFDSLMNVLKSPGSSFSSSLPVDFVPPTLNVARFVRENQNVAFALLQANEANKSVCAKAEQQERDS